MSGRRAKIIRRAVVAQIAALPRGRRESVNFTGIYRRAKRAWTRRGR